MNDVEGRKAFQWSNYDHMRLKGSLPDAFTVAEVPKHEIRSPHDWLFPLGISSGNHPSCRKVRGFSEHPANS